MALNIFSEIKCYLDGTMITFLNPDGVLIASEPRGSVRVKPYGQSGFTFIKPDTGETIASVKTFGGVKDSAGVEYGANFADTLTAINAFLGFSEGGGSGAGAVIEVVKAQNLVLDTTTGTFEVHSTLTHEFEAGNYDIEVFGIFGITGANGVVDVALFLDAVNTQSVNSGMIVAEKIPFSIKLQNVALSGSVTVSAQFRRATAGTTAQAYMSNIKITKVTT